MSTTDPIPSADIIFDTLFAYQKSAALKTAIDLDLFTAIDDGARTAAAIATRTNVSERGARILCDYLTVNRLLAKSDGTYQLVPRVGRVPQPTVARISRYDCQFSPPSRAQEQLREFDCSRSAWRCGAARHQHRLD